jgi:hypothetical protein
MLHHHDDDKESPSSIDAAYDANMLIALLLRVALALPPVAAVPAAVIDTAVAEAAGIWAPYRVAIEDARSCLRTDDDCRVLTVVPVVVPPGAARPGGAPGWRGALGQIRFAPDGVPESAITVFITDIEQFIAGAPLLDAFLRLRPQTLRQELFGRVLGRVLAHEIGHYVLRSPRHAADGLMRSVQFAGDLMSPSRHRFTLTAAEAARVEGSPMTVRCRD